MKVEHLRKAGMVVAATTLLLVACAKEDPEEERRRLQHAIESLDRSIANYKEHGFEGVEDLQVMRKKIEEELQALDSSGGK